MKHLYSQIFEPLFYIGMVMTVLAIIAVIGTFAPYQQVVEQGHPWLFHFKCSGCFLCGMTRSFCAMSALQFKAAYQWHPAGPFLYILLWVWCLTGVPFYILSLTKRVKLRSKTPISR